MSQASIAQYVSYTPLIILVASLVGIVVEVFLPLRIVPENSVLVIGIIGIVILALGQTLITLAHKHRALEYCNEGICIRTVGSGPYHFSRHPRYGGYLLMMIGLGCVMNSLPLLIMSGIVFLVLTFFIIPRQERMLVKEFPGTYEDYQKKVPMWL